MTLTVVAAPSSARPAHPRLCRQPKDEGNLDTASRGGGARRDHDARGAGTVGIDGTLLSTTEDATPGIRAGECERAAPAILEAGVVREGPAPLFRHGHAALARFLHGIFGIALQND